MKLFNYLLLALFAAVTTARLHAQNQTGPIFTVSTLIDRNNSTAKVNDCTLREALRASAASAKPAVIIFAPKLEGSITLTLGALNVTSPVSILGLGARKLAVVGGGSTRVFQITNGGPHLISGLSIRGGKVTTVFEDIYGGAGIYNGGTLVVKDCSLSENQTTAALRTTARGGAIFNDGSLTLIRCTLSGNTATGGGPDPKVNNDNYGHPGLGGAVYNNSGKELFAENTTFYNNSGIGGIGSLRVGTACGAIYNAGSMTLTGCTVSGNIGTGGAPNGGGSSSGVGGIWSEGGLCSMFSTIVAGNTVVGFPSYKDVRGRFSSQGYNLIGAASGSSSETNDVSGVGVATDQTGTNRVSLNAVLGSFQNNGGPTDSLLPAATSPAIDKGRRAGNGTDQRGLNRLYDHPTVSNALISEGVDVGAVEYFPTGSKLGELGTISFSNGIARVVIKGDPGVRYKLQFSDDLIVPFFNLGPEALADGLGNLEFFDPGPLPSRRFYRGISTP